MIEEPPPDGEPVVDLPAPVVHDHRWEQDPAGNWHRKSRAPKYMAWGAVILLAAGVVGYNVWQAHEEDAERERETRELTCSLIGGYDC